MERKDFLKLISAGGAASMLPYDVFAGLLEKEFHSSLFGPNFDWGVATAAYQIEGAYNVDGKGLSIWDTFTNKKGKIKNNENGNDATNHYYRYEEDLDLLKKMGFKNYRFSISWSRVFPNGIGEVNPKGVDFYHRLIDACKERGIEPWITLYHWDLPQALEDKGGWTNRAIIDWFSEYVEFCSKEFGSKVKKWMVLNEPLAFTAIGYLIGIHAPGKRGFGKFLPAVHHTALCQAEGGRILRKNLPPDAKIGTTFSCSPIFPHKQKEKNFKAAKRADAIFNRLFIEPSLGLGYPVDDFPALKRIYKYAKEGDREKLKFDFDFIGIQNYTREVIKRSMLIPILWAKQIPAKKRNVPLTAMGWEIFPEGIYNVLKQFSAYKGIKELYITENGVAFEDNIDQGVVSDKQRIEFLKDYLKQVLDAKKDGVNVNGYFYWTLMDNFEWAEGYHPRFGLIHVDFKTLERNIKDSGYWFKDFLS
jgi:beta-glucosidase